MSQPGTHHEEVGEGILIDHGFRPEYARFARTHGGPGREAHMRFEDWLVMLADHAWKGVRRQLIEDAVRDELANATNSLTWEVYLGLDDILLEVTASADRRLAWHSAQLA